MFFSWWVPTRSISCPVLLSSTSAPTATAALRGADVVLPGAAYPEKSAIYVNTEGRVQMATRTDRARRSGGRGEARCAWRRRGQGAIPFEHRRLLVHQSDRTLLRGDGRMFGDRARAHGENSGRVGE